MAEGYDWSSGSAKAVGSMFKSQSVPGVVARATRKKEKADALANAYEVVNRRDGNRCRATGVPLAAGDMDPRHRREHHHLRGRRVRPEWREKPERICLLSGFVHELVERGWIDIEGTDARKPLFFHYTSLAKSHPIQLKRSNPREKVERTT